MTRPLLAFAASTFVFHHLPALAGAAGDAIDLLTPFAVVGSAAAVLLALGAGPVALAIGLVASLLYVDGHGIHLAANAIAREPLAGDAERVAHFWDERFGHLEWHVGWIALLVAFGLADRGAALPRAAGALAALLLGWTLFTSTVEGGTWPLVLAAAAALGAWAVAAPRPLVVVSAGALALAAALVATWAAVNRGEVPEFSEVGLL